MTATVTNRESAVPDETLFKMWTHIPNGSSLVISVKGTKSDKLIIATLDGIETTPSGTILRKITGILDTVSGKPERISLKRPNIYTVDVINTFITDAEAVVHAHVEGPDGKQIDDALDTKLKRKKQQVEAVTLVVATRQGGGK
jgi:hypothetical protein